MPFFQKFFLSFPFFYFYFFIFFFFSLTRTENRERTEKEKKFNSFSYFCKLYPFHILSNRPGPLYKQCRWIEWWQPEPWQLKKWHPPQGTAREPKRSATPSHPDDTLRKRWTKVQKTLETSSQSTLEAFFYYTYNILLS